MLEFPGYEYSVLAATVVVQVIASFASPIAINMILQYVLRTLVRALPTSDPNCQLPGNGRAWHGDQTLVLAPLVVCRTSDHFLGSAVVHLRRHEDARAHRGTTHAVNL